MDAYDIKMKLQVLLKTMQVHSKKAMTQNRRLQTTL